MLDDEELWRENWEGKCRDCEWSYTDMGQSVVAATSRVHLDEVGEDHTVDILCDGEQQEVIDQVVSSSYPPRRDPDPSQIDEW